MKWIALLALPLSACAVEVDASGSSTIALGCAYDDDPACAPASSSLEAEDADCACSMDGFCERAACVPGALTAPASPALSDPSSLLAIIVLTEDDD